MTIDPAQIALDLMTRSTPRGEGATRDSVSAVLEADYTDDAEQVNGFGVYSAGRDAILAAAEKAAIANRTVGMESRIVSASQLAENVILAHVLSSARVPEGPLAGTVTFRFTVVVVNIGGNWKIRSSTTTLVTGDGHEN
jgi:hypothetical protein